MADQSISQLPVATALTGQELAVVVQQGVTKQCQVSDLTVNAGYTRITSGAGIPTTAPVVQAGNVPMYYDTVGSRLYVFNGLWVQV